MIYETIYGWFDYSELYDIAVAKSPNKSVFIEIGSYLGKSSAYMAEKIKDSGKNITFFCVDPFMQWDEIDNLYNRQEMSGFNGSFRHLFEKNIEPLKDYIHIVQETSKDAAIKYFPDRSADFVFIDGLHSYEGCKSDIELYYKILKPGGILGGHDYNNPQWEGVNKAVDEFISQTGLKLHVCDNSFAWYVYKPAVEVI